MYGNTMENKNYILYGFYFIYKIYNPWGIIYETLRVQGLVVLLHFDAFIWRTLSLLNWPKPPPLLFLLQNIARKFTCQGRVSGCRERVNKSKRRNIYRTIIYIYILYRRGICFLHDYNWILWSFIFNSVHVHIYYKWWMKLKLETQLRTIVMTLKRLMVSLLVLKVDFVTLACSSVSVFCNFLFSQTSTCVSNYCMETQKMLLFLNTCSYTACKLKE